MANDIIHARIGTAEEMAFLGSMLGTNFLGPAINSKEQQLAKLIAVKYGVRKVGKSTCARSAWGFSEKMHQAAIEAHSSANIEIDDGDKKFFWKDFGLNGFGTLDRREFLEISPDKSYVVIGEHMPMGYLDKADLVCLFSGLTDRAHTRGYFNPSNYSPESVALHSNNPKASTIAAEMRIARELLTGARLDHSSFRSLEIPPELKANTRPYNNPWDYTRFVTLILTNDNPVVVKAFGQFRDSLPFRL